MDKGRFFPRWWAGLKENYTRLWAVNCQYLLCMLPAAVCGFLFVRFHAYFFLLMALVLMVPAGPAMLAAQRLSMPYGCKSGRACMGAFWRAYKELFGRGAATGLCFGALTAVVFLPAYHALMSGGDMSGVICGSCACAAFLLLSCTSQLQHDLIEKGKRDRHCLIAELFSDTKASAMAGAIKLVWCLLAVCATYFSVGCALLGVPMIIRYTAWQLFYGGNDGTMD